MTILEEATQAVKDAMPIGEAINHEKIARAVLKSVGELIHYPECWDETTYPTLGDALSETGCTEHYLTEKSDDQ